VSDHVRNCLDQAAGRTSAVGWQPIASASFDCELELAVIQQDEPHALVFPCRRIPDGWIDARTPRRVDVTPTHWRKWVELQETS
jgi:hypothetical protein